MRLTYNAPFVLTYTFITAVVMIFSDLTAGHSTMTYFSLPPQMSLQDPVSYFRLFSHVCGHASWEHLLSNFTFILLLGPILEEKYGTGPLVLMSTVTALITGLLNIFFFTTGLLGASGIVFMLIILSSITNVKAGRVPLTFILILFLFLGQEITGIFSADNVSQFAHIVGGICGSVFGFLLKEGGTSPAPVKPGDISSKIK